MPEIFAWGLEAILSMKFLLLILILKKGLLKKSKYQLIPKEISCLCRCFRGLTRAFLANTTLQTGHDSLYTLHVICLANFSNRQVEIEKKLAEDSEHGDDNSMFVIISTVMKSQPNGESSQGDSIRH